MNETTPSDEGAITRERPPRWILVVLLSCIAALWILGTFTAAARPRLLRDHPLLLIALNARYQNLILTASRISWPVQIPIGVLRNLASDPIYYALGWFYGDAALRWLETTMGRQAGQWVRSLEYWFKRSGVLLVFFFPGTAIGQWVCVLAGSARMRARRFWPVNIAGTVFMVTLVRLFAGVVKGPSDAVLRFNNRYNRWLLVLSIGFALFFLVRGGATVKMKSLRDAERELGDREA